MKKHFLFYGLIAVAISATLVAGAVEAVKGHYVGTAFQSPLQANAHGGDGDMFLPLGAITPLPSAPASRTPFRLAPMRAVGDEGDTYYALVYSSGAYPNRGSGYARFSLSEAPSQLDFLFNLTSSTTYAKGGVVWEGRALGVKQSTVMYQTTTTITLYDTENGTVIKELNPSKNFEIYAGQYDPDADLIYGSFLYSGQCYWGTLKPETGELNTIMSYGYSSSDPVQGVFRSPDGEYYAISKAGVFYKVNKSNGERTQIAPANDNLTTMNGQKTSGAWDPTQNRIIYSVLKSATACSLWSIDPSNGEASLIFNYPYMTCVFGMYIPQPAAEPGAPAAVSDIAIDFNDETLVGTVSFVPPSTTFDGNAASGEVTYSIQINEQPPLTGLTVFGAEKVSVPVTLSSAGSYQFTVWCSNAEGDGKKQSVKKYIGHDVPVAPKSAIAEYADGVFTVKWDAVDGIGANGGPIGADNISYVVTMQPEGVQVVTSPGVTTATFAVKEPEDLTTYSFTVAAHSIGGDSQTTVSNCISLGAATPPYSNNFTTPDELSQINHFAGGENLCDWEHNVLGSKGWMRVKYNNDKNVGMDAYLCSPKLLLGKNMRYTITVKMSGHLSSYSERFALLIGKEATPEGFDTVLIEPTDINCTTSSAQEFTVSFTAPESAAYYLAVHGCSDPDKYYLYCGGISISEPINTGAPRAVSDLSVTADQNGAMKATVSFSSPRKNVSGNILSGLTKAEIRRNGVTVADLPLTSSTVTWVDNDPEYGSNTYTVIPYNDSGAGEASAATDFVGFSDLAPITGLTIAETADQSGVVQIKWDAVTKDVNGKNLSGVTYTIGDVNGNTIASDISGTSYTYTATNSGQVFVANSIIAKSPEGKSSYFAYTDLIPVGKHDVIPWQESFANGSVSHAIGVVGRYGAYTYADYGIVRDDAFSQYGIVSADNDNGMFALVNTYGSLFGAVGVMAYTGYIDIPADLNNPAISWQYFGFTPDSHDNVEILIRTDASDDYMPVGNIACQGTGQWRTASMDISAYKGKRIQVGVAVYSVSNPVVLVDDIRIGSAPDVDLGAMTLSAPSMAFAGQPFDIILTYGNLGRKAIEAGYDLTLYQDGKEVSTLTGEALDPGEYATVTFSAIISPVGELASSFRACAKVPGDEVDNNDASPVVSIVGELVEWPVPGSLSASRADGTPTVNLSWEAPDLNALPFVTEPEGFETGNAGDMTYEGWTIIDGDNAVIGTLSTIDQDGNRQPIAIPGIVWGTTKAGFFVNDGHHGVGPRSGSNCMVSVFNADGKTANDDWLITPELAGEAQTASFWARSVDATGNFAETMEVLYSVTGTAVEDFKLLATVEKVPSSWTNYNIELPEGALYMAVRNVSKNCFILALDDFDIALKDDERLTLNLKAYNIYRDGMIIETQTSEHTSFADNDADGAAHTYVVTALYEEGESASSDCANVSALSSLSPRLVGAGPIVSVEGREIVVTNTGGALVTVHSVDGSLVCSRRGDGRFYLSPAVYVVWIAGKTYKVIVI